jgi:hypothetical protein
MIQDLPLPSWRRNRKVCLLLDLTHLSDDARTLIKQDHNLLIDVVDLRSTGRKPTICVRNLLTCSSDRVTEREWYAGKKNQD